MNTTGQLTGSAYTSDPEYYEFLGAPKRGVIYDWSRRCWVECTIRAPKTPADAITPADIDAQLAPEALFTDEERAEGYRVRQGYDRAPKKEIADLLRNYGPLSIDQMNYMTGRSASSLDRLLRRGSQMFAVVGKVDTDGRGRRPLIWDIISKAEE